MSIRISAEIETWPLAGAFVISRGAKTEAQVVVATVRDGAHMGRGECVPYARYGETVEGVAAAIASLDQQIESRGDLLTSHVVGAARNAIDCALWDLEAKRSGQPAHVLAGLPALVPCTSCYTISLGAPDTMAAAAKAAVAKGLPLIKLKLGGDGDAERLRAVRGACPTARLVADANEAWREASLPALMQVAFECGLELVEQPLPAADDAALAGIPRRVPVCADESLHTRGEIASLLGRYDAINVKLDKAGGLSEALLLAQAARAHGLRLMVGCMVATSLAMAPAMLLAQQAEWVDLDGPLLLAKDRAPGLRYDGALVYPPDAALWG